MPSARAFVHYDFQPNFLAPFGSWLFHVIRMREPLSLHDGVLSAARAHTGAQLLEAARQGAPGFKASIVNARIGGAFPRVFHALVGVRA